FWSVVTVRARLVDVSVRVTVASVIEPPVRSRIVPRIVPVTACAAAVTGNSKMKTSGPTLRSRHTVRSRRGGRSVHGVDVEEDDATVHRSTTSLETRVTEREGSVRAGQLLAVKDDAAANHRQHRSSVENLARRNLQDVARQDHEIRETANLQA